MINKFLHIFRLFGALLLLTLFTPQAVFSHQLNIDMADFTQGMAAFPNLRNYWGMNNISFFSEGSQKANVMRIVVPKGAIDPGTMSLRSLPRGGAGFKSESVPLGSTHALLSYRVRFPSGFDFVRGGKLPGLYGGAGNSGGKIPDGTDGFSFRLMWGKDGAGEVYAYLPSSIKYGTGFFRKAFFFTPGVWHDVVQELQLNTPGLSDGFVRLWFDGRLVGEEKGLLIRSVDSLKINGLFLDFFFGGNDDSWAPKQDTYVDFSSFRIRTF